MHTLEGDGVTARTRLARSGRITVLAVGCLLAAVVPAVVVAGPAEAAKAPAPHYYLALGDWLATGIGASSSANDYVNLVAAHEAARYPSLQAVDLGCGGATTVSMADGPGCSYTTGTQLGDAVAFLRAHPRQVAFVTIDIGADDVAACQSSSGLDTTCAAAAISQISTDLPQELAALKAAGPGGPHLRDELLRPLPGLLADRGSTGQSVATQSIASTDQLNALLGQIYTAAGASTADPSSLFATDDTDIGRHLRRRHRAPGRGQRCASGPTPARHRGPSSPTTRGTPNWRRPSSRSSTACPSTRRGCRPDRSRRRTRPR